MKTFHSFLKITFIILAVTTLGLFVALCISALQERPPEHPLDFQDIKEIVLDKQIKSIEDGLPYARKRAYEWRQDSVLTGLEIISRGKEEIANNTGSLEYIFEFPCIDKSKPSGIMFIFINTVSNSIDHVSASHDGEGEERSFTELKTDNLTERIKKVYDIAKETIGDKNIFKFEQPFVRVHINSDFATFEVSPSQSESNQIMNRVKIDMRTYDVVK
ncbi:MAG: hypothetical protein K0S61_4334 [Anaerocolumna sp.]|jgi:hypothetical protein|nr:hypothetical protein [Anaerocolumna sp.]